MSTPFQLPATVAICTYNGAARIGLVIEALAAQTQPVETWELLVIDNASTDDTAGVCDRLFKKFVSVPGRVVREEHAGLSFARTRAAQESQGEIICFLDDDNIPEPDFVKNAILAFKDRPQTGLLGGKVFPCWECKPTPLALAVADYALAICDRGDQPFRYEGISSGPVGAGMCIRTRLLREFYSNADFAKITGRKGTALGAGEDAALFVRTHQAGWEVWYDPRMVIAHSIPKRRIQKEYLLRLYDGFGRCDIHVRALFDRKAQFRSMRTLIGLKDFGRWIFKGMAGPSRQLRQKYPELAKDIHELEQRMALARAQEAIWPQRS